MQQLYMARNALEAHFLRQMLEERGIPAQVLGESLMSARGGLPMTAETLPSVWVRAEDVERAIAVLDAFKAESESPASSADSWQCPNCGEQGEPGFEICWKCRTPRPSADE